MSNINFFKQESKNLLKDWKTQSITIRDDGTISYHYENKFYNMDEFFTALNWNDKDRSEIMLVRAQHLIAKITGFRNWNDLIHASKRELEKGEKILRSKKSKLHEINLESDKNQSFSGFRIRCMGEMTLEDKKSFKIQLPKIVNKIKNYINTDSWLESFELWETLDDNGNVYTFFERRDDLKEMIKRKQEGYSKITKKAYNKFRNGKNLLFNITDFVQQLGISIFKVNLANNKIAGFCTRFLVNDANLEIAQPIIVINEQYCNTKEKFLKEIAKQLYYMIAKDDEFNFTYDQIRFEMKSTQNEAEKFVEDLFIPLDKLNEFINNFSTNDSRWCPSLTIQQKEVFLREYMFEFIINGIKSHFSVDYKTAIKKLLESCWEYKFMFETYEEAENFYFRRLKKHEEEIEKIRYLNGEPEPLQWEVVCPVIDLRGE